MGYVEDNDAIAAYDSRVTISKKVYRKYTNGKREVYVAGTAAKSLASSNETVMTLADADSNEGSFTCKFGGDTYLGFAVKGSGGSVLNINIKHSITFSSGAAFSLYFVFFV